MYSIILLYCRVPSSILLHDHKQLGILYTATCLSIGCDPCYYGVNREVNMYMVAPRSSKLATWTISHCKIHNIIIQSHIIIWSHSCSISVDMAGAGN